MDEGGDGLATIGGEALASLRIALVARGRDLLELPDEGLELELPEPLGTQPVMKPLVLLLAVQYAESPEHDRGKAEQGGPGRREHSPGPGPVAPQRLRRRARQRQDGEQYRPGTRPL
jgi:hypothetical protein